MRFASTLALYIVLTAFIASAWIEWTDPNRS